MRDLDTRWAQKFYKCLHLERTCSETGWLGQTACIGSGAVQSQSTLRLNTDGAALVWLAGSTPSADTKPGDRTMEKHQHQKCKCGMTYSFVVPIELLPWCPRCFNESKHTKSAEINIYGMQPNTEKVKGEGNES